MSLFKKMLGRSKSAKSDPSPESESPEAPEQSAEQAPPKKEKITMFDKFGRPMQIPREEWRERVLLPKLKEFRNQPEDLAKLIITALRDDFVEDVVEATEHLVKIDTNPQRAYMLLGIVYLDTDEPAKAAKVMEKCLKEHGEDAQLLLNLAKAYGKQDMKDKELENLWRSLEVNPNHEHAVPYQLYLAKQYGGDAAIKEILDDLAELPGAWRPQLYQARHLLATGQEDAAMELYRSVFKMVKDPVSADMLVQVTGDLGRHGHLEQILELTQGRFRPELHGIAVGNNLLKARLDLGQLDEGLAMVQDLYACQRPEWRQHLAFWENEFKKMKYKSADEIDHKDLKVGLLSVDGPVWMQNDSLPDTLFPQRSKDAPRVCFLGSSAENETDTEGAPPEAVARHREGMGRMSRAIPLFLCEQVYLRGDVNAHSFIPWILSPGGFVLSSKPSSDAEVSAQVRRRAEPDDYAVITHLVVNADNWRLEVRILRTRDAVCIGESAYDFAAGRVQPIIDQVLADVYGTLCQETDMKDRGIPELGTLKPEQLDHYLFRSEQALAVRCSSIDQVEEHFLSNIPEIVDGAIDLCLRNPTHVASRLLLLSELKHLSKKHPKLVASYQTKVKALQADVPAGSRFDGVINDALATLWGN